MPTLLEALRAAASDEVWSAAVRLGRQGEARLVKDDGDEQRWAVRVPGRPLPLEIYLWPAEPDWSCDCGSRAKCCVHAAAAAITAHQRERRPDDAPAAHTAPRVVHALRRHGQGLLIERFLERPDPQGGSPRRERLEGSLARSGAWCTPGDLEAEKALLTRIGPRIPTELWPRLLTALAEASVVTLDGQPVRCSAEARSGVARVEDDGPGFLVRLVRDPRIEEVFEGGVLRCGDCLHPAARNQLEEHERLALTRGIAYAPGEVGRLVGELLPRLERRLPVDVRTKRLPKVQKLPPHLHLLLAEGPEHSLEVLPTLRYGDPPCARIDGDHLVLLGRGEVPLRDPPAEERVRARCLDLCQVAPGRRRSLTPPEAVDFVARLQGFEGHVEGAHLLTRFRLVARDLHPRVAVHPHAAGGYRVEIDGDGASPEALVAAWQGGQGLVPLLEGGFAPLPAAWLEQHGWTLTELLAARDEQGRVPTHAAALLAEVAEALPASLEGLRRLAQGFEGLPQAPLPAGLRAELRPYQRRGVDWLAFLRAAGLGGLLADDMGLGKTLQALVAIASVPGPSLVVAPTSVLRNWVLEAARFLPGLSVCLYHGPQRRLDPGAHLVVTSYALLRLDAEALCARPWRYAVLDEAQTIKNPDAQVARAARRLTAEHRLALTGTPVENRLEELWSLFAFALPGFLGQREGFSAKVADALGGPDQRGALTWLRRRVRPFVLRRMKREVAPELPPRTEMVLTCELSDDERGLYEVLRQAALRDVGAALVAGRTLSVLEALLRLRQAACHPGLLPGRAETRSSKLDLLVERLATLAEEGHRALVFSQWTSFLDLCEPALAEAGISACRLDGSTRDRQAVVERFQAEDGPTVFLLSLKAGGTGLNLTAADYVFHLDPWWNPAVEDQAVDRAHRIGQDKPVFSVRLVAAGTVEERIVALQHAKRDLAAAAIGDEGLLAANLTSAELLALFE